MASPKRRNKKSDPNSGSIHRGRRTSCLECVSVPLLRWMFELREQGMPVSLRMVYLKAGELNASFRRKSVPAKYASVRRFVRSHRFVIRIKTHVSQRPPSETQQEALDFVKFMRPRIIGRHRHPDYIINMDQTPIFFSMTPGTTLDQVGVRSVNVRTSTSSTVRVTLTVTITGSGKSLTPMMVYKGKPTGRIQLGFPNYPEGCFYACQERAWMDESVMLAWIDKVLKPYIKTAPIGIHPVILLDHYRFHMMESVVNIIQDLGCAVEHIPGGCTGLAQPVDVGIGKPLKNRVRRHWEDWMLNTGVANAATKAPSRQRVAQWCIDSLNDLGTNIIKNSWRHGEYSYFPTV